MIQSAGSAYTSIVPPAATSPLALDVSLRSLLFRELPPSFSALLHKSKEPSNEQGQVEERKRKYDVRKTIRIMRDLLNLRQRAQEKVVQAAFQSKEPVLHTASDVQSLPSICVEYFSLSFGSDALGMVRRRILGFLEAAVIFSSYPLFSYLTQYFFMSIPLVDRQELNLW